MAQSTSMEQTQELFMAKVLNMPPGTVKANMQLILEEKRTIRSSKPKANLEWRLRPGFINVSTYAPGQRLMGDCELRFDHVLRVSSVWTDPDLLDNLDAVRWFVKLNNVTDGSLHGALLLHGTEESGLLVEAMVRFRNNSTHQLIGFEPTEFEVYDNKAVYQDKETNAEVMPLKAALSRFGISLGISTRIGFVLTNLGPQDLKVTLVTLANGQNFVTLRLFDRENIEEELGKVF